MPPFENLYTVVDGRRYYLPFTSGLMPPEKGFEYLAPTILSTLLLAGFPVTGEFQSFQPDQPAFIHMQSQVRVNGSHGVFKLLTPAVQESDYSADAIHYQALITTVPFTITSDHTFEIATTDLLGASQYRNDTGIPVPPNAPLDNIPSDLMSDAVSQLIVRLGQEPEEEVKASTEALTRYYVHETVDPVLGITSLTSTMQIAGKRLDATSPFNSEYGNILHLVTNRYLVDYPGISISYEIDTDKPVFDWVKAQFNATLFVNYQAYTTHGETTRRPAEKIADKIKAHLANGCGFTTPVVCRAI